MYTKQEASQIRQQFWTRFGQYMRPVLGADREKKNWLNYKTGVRDLFFRMDADNHAATISIQLQHDDDETREQMFEKFVGLKKLLEEYTKESWYWELHTHNEVGKKLSKISHRLEKVNIFDSSDWPAIISFLKLRIIALDAFWSDTKDVFQ